MKGMTPIVRSAAAVIFPVMLIFGIYVMLYGETSIGGGFTAGVILASAYVLLVLSCGGERAEKSIKASSAIPLACFGALLFIVAAAAGLLAGPEISGPGETREIALMQLQNIGVGLLVTGSLYGIFISLAALRVKAGEDAK